MSLLALPPSIADQLSLSGETSRSLLFDRRAPIFESPGSDREEAVGNQKRQLLAEFCGSFSRPKGFDKFLERRAESLGQLGAVSIQMETSSRLIVGFGLPHPVETGLLLDRITGCPYVPGSSVKGLLRAAAEKVAKGELAVEDGDARSFFSEHRERLFGPELGGDRSPARGDLTVYDAFPASWPRLELDVLTPHQSEYGDGKAVPADWHQPIPVNFLTVEPKTKFRFFFRGRNARSAESDVEQVIALLKVALDWLGVGAKKSSGYGVFASPAIASAQEASTTVWRNAVLLWQPNEGRLVATKDDSQADSQDRSLLDILPDERRDRLTRKRNRKTIEWDVKVRQRGAKWFEIVGLVPRK